MDLIAVQTPDGLVQVNLRHPNALEYLRQLGVEEETLNNFGIQIQPSVARQNEICPEAPISSELEKPMPSTSLSPGGAQRARELFL